jgi:hypothetical protein
MFVKYSINFEDPISKNGLFLNISSDSFLSFRKNISEIFFVENLNISENNISNLELTQVLLVSLITCAGIHHMYPNFVFQKCYYPILGGHSWHFGFYIIL